MEILNKIRNILGKEQSSKLAVLFGIVGMLLIMLSSLIPDKKTSENSDENTGSHFSENFRSDTEGEMEKFLSLIEGAGDVEVYITVGSSERYIYATEGRKSKTDDRSEEEKKYVIIGGDSGKAPIVQTVECPEITGAAVLCTGGDIPEVRERVYRTVSAALGLPTGKIYVTKLG